MKQKFFLIITLVLLAVQGWAMPIDSLETLIHKNNLQNKLSNLSNVGIEKPIDANVLGLSGGKNSSSLVHMEFDPSSLDIVAD